MIIAIFFGPRVTYDVFNKKLKKIINTTFEKKIIVW